MSMNRPTRPTSGLAGFLARLLGGGRKAEQAMAAIKAEIAVPTDGSRVPYRVSCEGTHSGVAEAIELWLFVYCANVLEGPEAEEADPISVFYPQSAPILRLPGGLWHSAISIGPSERESAGKTYDVLLVATPRGATRQITKYNQESSARGKWSGMFNLPHGSVVLDTITVTRD